MNIKKILAVVFAAILVLSMVACSKENEDGNQNENNGGLNDEQNVYNDFLYSTNDDGDFEISGYVSGSTTPKSIEIPSKIDGRDVTGIAADAFKACKTIKAVIIPDSITYIGQYAFYDCDSLESVILPEGVTEISQGAFQDCDALSSVSFSDYTAKIGDFAFKNCKALKSISLPDSLKEIGDGAFWGCDAMESVTLPLALTKIGDAVFYSCKSLKLAVALGDVSDIGEIVFNDCNDEFKIKVKSGTAFAQYAADNGYQLYKG